MTSSRKVGLVNEVKKKTLFRYLVLLLLRIGIIKIARISAASTASRPSSTLQRIPCLVLPSFFRQNAVRVL